jgi:hypothetical protein
LGQAKAGVPEFFKTVVGPAFNELKQQLAMIDLKIKPPLGYLTTLSILRTSLTNI